MMISLLSFAQQPFINSISPASAEVGRTVEISGLNLSGTPRVFFGGVEGNILSNTDNLIQAEVPAGAANAPIYVLNNGEITQSSEHFFISFGGGSAISQYDAEFAVSTTVVAASDICTCDLNGDGKNDIVIVQNRDADINAAEATIYLNNTTGTDAFTGTDFQISQSLNIDDHSDGFVSVTCNDLDNDGIKDLAFASNFGTDANDIYILKNPGTGIFSTTATATKTLPTTAEGDQRQPGNIVSADIDRDGLLDLVVGNNASDGVFHIFRNTGSPGTISFADAEEFQANGEPTGLLHAADFNNNGYLDIVTLPFRETSSGINLFRNQSVTGSFEFTFDQSLTNGGQTSDIEVGDLDNDGDLDILVASNLTGRISYFENQSGSVLNFGGSNNLSSTATTATGVSLADINGDGSLDIVNANGAGGIYIFPNTSSTDISFGSEQVQTTSSTAPSTGSTRNIVTADFNGDGKPDIAYTKDVQLDEVGSLGIILNRNCIVPEITPTDFQFCTGEPFIVRTTNAINATINWELLTPNLTITANGNQEAELTVNSGANASFRVTITQDGCSESSEIVSLTIAGGALIPTTPSIDVSTAGILCEGDVVTLSSSVTGDTYYWTLPDGSEQSTPTIQLNPVSAKDAGTYGLRIQNTEGCISDEATQVINVSSVPGLSITNSGLTNFCDELVLQVPDFSGDLTYQWKESGTNLGVTTPALTVSQSGTYTVEATNTNDCSSETASITVNKVDLPVSVIDGPTETCVDFLTNFTAASTGETGFTLQYNWSILNADNVEIFNSTAASIDYNFTLTGAYTIELSTNYNPSEVYPGPNANDLCFDTEIINLTVSDPPTLTFDQTDGVQKCQDDILTIGLTSPTAGNITSYDWVVRNATDGIIGTSTGATVEVETLAGIDNVYAVANITTSIGCTVIDSVLIRNFPSTVDISSPDFATIASADSATLQESISINLTAENLVSNIAWEPADLIDNPTGISVEYFPRSPSSTVTLSGTDADGCNVSSQVIIYLDNLRPKKVFSPNNGDDINNCWEILNIGELGEAAGCEVFIFDSRGRNLTNAITSFTNGNCVWDGTAFGSDVPEGVYYYILKCRDEEFSKSGSILLAR